MSPAPALYSYTVGRASTDVGVPVSLEAVAIGGVGTLQYAYSGLPAGCSSSNSPILTCTPSAPGSYSIVLTVSDAGPFTTLGTVNLTVLSDPSISLTATTPEVDVGLPLGASALVSNGTAPLTVSWKFGDGGSATGSSAEHIYDSPGTFSVEARVVDGLGVASTASLTVRVGSPLGSRIEGPASGSAQAPVSLNGTAIAGVAPYSFVWTFGDGASVQTGVIGSNAPNSSEVSHPYAVPANYHVTVLVSDGGGERSLSSWNVTVGPAGPSQLPPKIGSGGPGASSSILPPAILGADAVVAVALILLAIAVRPRRPAPTDPPDRTPPSGSDPGKDAAPPSPGSSGGPVRVP